MEEVPFLLGHARIDNQSGDDGDVLLCLNCISIFLAHRIRISEISLWDRKPCLTYVILPRISREGCTHLFYWTRAHGSQVTSLLC